jgi:hypothetical protein
MATAGQSQQNIVASAIGFDPSTGKYHFIDPQTTQPTQSVELMWSSYLAQAPRPTLCWLLDSRCDHAIDVKLDCSGVNPPPVAPPQIQKTITAGGGTFFRVNVVPGAWPPATGGIKRYPYKVEVRAEGSTAWQPLDPELQLERPVGFSSSLLIFATGMIVGAAAVVGALWISGTFN